MDENFFTCPVCGRENVRKTTRPTPRVPSVGEIINKLNAHQAESFENIRYCSCLDKQKLAQAIHNLLEGKE